MIISKSRLYVLKRGELGEQCLYVIEKGEVSLMARTQEIKKLQVKLNEKVLSWIDFLQIR